MTEHAPATLAGAFAALFLAAAALCTVSLWRRRTRHEGPAAAGTGLRAVGPSPTPTDTTRGASLLASLLLETLLDRRRTAPAPGACEVPDRGPASGA